jgi:hypothetical protein
MKSLFYLTVLVLLVSGWGLAAASLHVVRTPHGIPITLVPKSDLGLSDTYVDTRTWTLSDVPLHAVVVERLIRTGKADALRHVVDESIDSDVETQLAEALIGPGRNARPARGRTPLAQAWMSR